MRVNPAAARKLTRRIARAERRGQTGRADRLRARRRKVDQRFDPDASLRATARYLNLAKVQLGGREDYAVAGYHMGIGNLQSVLRDYGQDPGSYTALYFGTHARRASRRLPPPGRARRRLVHLPAGGSRRRSGSCARYRQDRGALEREDELQLAKNSSEEVLHPRGRHGVFAGPDDLEAAYRDGSALVSRTRPPPGPAPRPADGRAGDAARAAARCTAALRPEAYALAAYMARMTREAGGGRAPLTVTSTVRDREYQRLLVGRNSEATQNYSLHTTGYAFDVLRRYSGGRQAQAFQYTLNRLQALNLIAWVREPAAIHITASGDADRLVPAAPGLSSAQVIMPPNWPPVMFSTWPCT